MVFGFFLMPQSATCRAEPPRVGTGSRLCFSIAKPKQSAVPEQAEMPSAQGFSLVELSIVLVILGLLVGGVLTGQSLIRAAELRSVSTEYEKFSAATNTFRDKYFQLPGDMNNAESFWGTAHATDATCISTSTGTTATCNGNGNGHIHWLSARSNEYFRFWQHLANAGLIESTYTGTAGAGGSSHAVIGQNVPRAKFPKSGWGILTHTYTANGVFTDKFYKNQLIFGGEQPTDVLFTPTMTPEEAWNVDTKMDDGQPQRGKVWAVRWDSCTDAASSADLDGNYLLSSNSALCVLIFDTGL